VLVMIPSPESMRISFSIFVSTLLKYRT
jgi:hypothetical protein